MSELPSDDLRSLDSSTTYDLEIDHAGVFCWTRQHFVLAVPESAPRFATLEIAAPLPDTRLSFDPAGSAHDLDLIQGWQTIDVAVAGHTHLSVTVSREFRPDGDGRVLGIMVRSIVFHDDARLHRVIVNRQANRLANMAEFLAGVETIETVPPYLRVTTETVCNIANETPCVYCAWDWAKRRESGAPEFTPAFADSLGSYLSCAHEVNDCSFGEPPLNREFEHLLKTFTNAGRWFSFTTNGQTLGPRIRKLLLGRHARVTVSIDASTPQGYRRYRDHRFDLVVRNVAALCAERADHNGLPEVYVSFIAMRSNRDDIDAFLALMKQAGVDRVVFRALYLEDYRDARIETHYGARFDYEDEVLNTDELADLEQDIRAAARRHDVLANVEWRAFVDNHGPGDGDTRPLCSEPWQTAYLLNRGIMPCCYGGQPIVSWDEVDLSDPEAGLAAVLNSEPYRDLRRDLAAGRLGSYCRNTRSCPIVKAHLD